MVTSGIRDKQILNTLGPATVRDFEVLQHRVTYRTGEKLFAEGGEPSGIFVLSSGGVRLSVSDSSGTVLSSRRALPREVLGLSATVSGKPHQMTAETTAS